MNDDAAIDVHTHVVPESFPAYAGRGSGIPWPSMAADGCGHANIMISGKVFREVGASAWDPATRVKEMAAMGMHRQVLSPMPELLSYWLPAEDAAVLLRHTNEQIARMVSAQPARFSGLAAVPLQDVDRAVAELEHAMRALGLAGVEIGSNVNGVPIGDARFEDFFAAAEALGAAVFVHALRPAKERLLGPPVLEQIVGFPCEMSLAIASMITGGMLERHPTLRIGFSHGGGAFALVLARMEHTWHKVPAFRDSLPQAPSAYARRLYYDTAVFNHAALRFLLDTFGAHQLMIGTDYPFGSHERAPLELLRSAGLTGDEYRAVRAGNARRYLQLQEPAA